MFDEVDKGYSLQFMSRYNLLLNTLIEDMKIDIIAITHNPIAMLMHEKIYWFEYCLSIDAKTYLEMETGLKL